MSASKLMAPALARLTFPSFAGIFYAVSHMLAQSGELQTMNDSAPLTLSVPEAGRRYFGLSRVSAYAAATRGEIPTVRIGRLLRVPVRALEHMLDKATESREAAA
jgi:Helix-turn-helix domain